MESKFSFPSIMQHSRVFDKLFEPVKIGKVNIKNRIAMAPMNTPGLCDLNGAYTQRLIDYYVERARGGVGLIITGATKIENEIEKYALTGWPMILNRAHFLQRASELTEAIHTFDTKIFCQLTIGRGRVAKPTMLYTRPVAPSPIPNYWNPSIICRELTISEIEKIVHMMGWAAEIVAEAGFDGIEIHGMHEGYLLDQFTIAMWNKRTDKYGGEELEKRLTLPIEILHIIKDKVGKDFPVQLRFSIKSYVKDWGKGALPGEIFKEAARDIDEGLEVARILEKEGYDALNADAGSYEAWYWAHPPTYMPHGCYLDLTEKLKKVVKIPILVAGKMDLPELAEEAIEKGKADIIALGRVLLADPYWPIKVREGRVEDIRPCIGCHTGCIGRTWEGKPLCCAVNPTVGRERLYGLKPVQKIKKVIIVGGGVAGMEAARIAAIRGHDVYLFEKSDSLGGHLIEASRPSFKKDVGRLLAWYRTQLMKLKVNIILNVEVTPELIKKENPDVVILATGSEPIKPEIKGIEKPIVTTCIDLLRGGREAGKRVVIIGGGTVGCETALWLATEQKKEVTIIEKLSDLMITPPIPPHMNRLMLLDLIALNKIKVMTNVEVREITDQGLIVHGENFGSKEIECDTIALAVGFKPTNNLYNILEKEKIAQFYSIGDCKKPRRILDAIWEGYFIANEI